MPTPKCRLQFALFAENDIPYALTSPLFRVDYAPINGGGGGQPQGNLDFWGKPESNSPPLGLVNVKFHISPLKFLAQQTILDIKIPSLGELHDV